MAKITRFNGNLQAFASAEQADERTVFGGVTQSDALTDQITAEYLRGWGIVGPNDEPTLQDFNALGFTLGQLLAYLHQAGVPEWHAGQEYFIGSLATTPSGLWQSQSAPNIGNDPLTDDGGNWNQLAGSVEKRVASVDAMANDETLRSGDVITTDEHTAGWGFAGSNRYRARDVTGATGNLHTVIKSVANPTIEFVAMWEGVANFKQFGIRGDGVQNDTAAYVAAVESGLSIEGNLGDIYAISGLARATTEGQKINWRGAAIDWDGTGSYNEGAVYSQNGQTPLLITADGVEVHHGTIIGPSVGVFTDKERGVVILGTSSADRITRGYIHHMEIYDVGMSAIAVTFANECDVSDRNYVHDCGYAGVDIISSDTCRASRNRVQKIGPGSAGNMYGLSASHDSALWPGDQTTSPFSTDILFSENFVDDINWEGISNHGGERMRIIDNTVTNCKYGCALTASSGAAQILSGGDHVIAHNFIDGNSRACEGFGVNVNGGTDAAGRNTRVLVNDNVIVRHGLANNGSGGAIQCQFGLNVVIADNVVDLWGGVGIYVAGANSSNIQVLTNQINGMNQADAFGYGIAVGNAMSGLKIHGNYGKVGLGTIANTGIRNVVDRQAGIYQNNIFATTPINSIHNECADSDTTPSVAHLADHDTMFFNQAGTMTVTGLDGMRDNQEITLVNLGTGTITFDRTIARLQSSSNWIGPQYATLKLVKVAGQVQEVSRITNNG